MTRTPGGSRCTRPTRSPDSTGEEPDDPDTPTWARPGRGHHRRPTLGFHAPDGSACTRPTRSPDHTGDEPDDPHPALSPTRSGTPPKVLLDRLAKARLVTLGEDSVEVAHEALSREWPTLHRWLTEDSEGLRIHRRLTEAAAEWDENGREEELLYRGGRLASAREWATGNETRLNDLEREFLTASSERERDELAAARRRNRRLRALSAVLVVLLVVAVWQHQVAQRRGDLATARQLAAQATAKSDQQPLSLLLSLESLRVVSTAEARDTLVQGLLEPRHNTVALTGHTDSVVGLAFSPDGKTIASASADRTVRRWDAHAGTLIGPTPHRPHRPGMGGRIQP
ncbi:MAG: WD40 repeat domain-containing protein [Egibacteraceae bacterium]